MSPNLEPVRKIASGWKSEVARRRKVSGTDPIADALDYCAAEVLDAVREAEAADQWLSVTDYAAKHGKRASTVRRWCRRGLLGAEQLADGDYRIPVRAVGPISRAS